MVVFQQAEAYTKDRKPKVCVRVSACVHGCAAVSADESASCGGRPTIDARCPGSGRAKSPASARSGATTITISSPALDRRLNLLHFPHSSLQMIDALMPTKRRLVGATPAARAHAAASAASAFAHKPRSDSRSSLMAKPGAQLKLLKELG